MPYGRRTEQDSISAIVPLLFATAAASLLAIVWRQRAAPRSVIRRPRNATPRAVLSATPPATGDDLQTVHCGTGCVFHRMYSIEVAGTAHRAADVMRLMQHHFAELAPSILARFQKTTGAHEAIRVDDEFEITMLGPWNGMVRAVDVSDASFTLATLEGHPEAGHITFSVIDDPEPGAPLTVHIESWARARDSLVATAYDTLRIGKRVQTEAWITFLQRLAARAGVDGKPEVRVTDEELSVDDAAKLTPTESADG
jgi:Domain of unknown function (DUF1990)